MHVAITEQRLNVRIMWMLVERINAHPGCCRMIWWLVNPLIQPYLDAARSDYEPIASDKRV